MRTPPATPPNVKSAGRFADVLEFVGRATEPPTFSEIAEGLGVPKSSLFNLLGTLAARGYLQQHGPRGAYHLGGMIATLEQQRQQPASYALRAEPILKTLVARLNEACGYYELRGDELEVIRAESSTQALAHRLYTGNRVPLYCVSAGKALLAQLSAAERRAYLQRTPLRRYTPVTIASATALTRQLKQAREEGFAVARDEHNLGTTGIAVAVHSKGRTVGAFNVAMPSVRCTAEMAVRVRSALAQAAAAFERGA
jgi:DNA-binding IclR family transcriptional regulator